MDATILSWSKRLIGCRSVTSEGTRAIMEMCAHELLAPLGIRARLLPSPHEGSQQVNLLAKLNGSDRSAAPLVLNTHLDTVPPGDLGLWTECAGDPFAAVVKGDRIYGLGAADTKLDFLAKSLALAGCGRPRRDVYLVATFSEEHGLVGAKEMAETGLLPRGALAYVGEASHLQAITAHKGLMAFELQMHFEPNRADGGGSASKAVFIGRAAHSSTPLLGRNAILAALDAVASRPKLKVASIEGGDAVNKVPARCELIVAGDFATTLAGASHAEAVDLAPTHFIPAQTIAALSQFLVALQGFADASGTDEADYAPPTLTCNPGVIKSSADAVTLLFELRPPPALSLEVVRKGVREIVANLEHGTPEVDFALTETRANPGFRSAPESETVELAMAALAEAGLPLEHSVKAGCTEAGIYAAAGLIPIVFGPGPSTGVIHAPNEYNLLSDVDGAVAFYRALLRL